jgi:hypothetical protein
VVVRRGGTLDIVKRFVASGFPVILEKGTLSTENEWLGHYTTVTAFDDASQPRFRTLKTE